MVFADMGSLTSLFAQANKAPAGGGDGAAAALGGLVCSFVVWAVFTLIMVVSQWKVFSKAGQPGWASLVPIYNIYIIVVEIAKKDMMWFLLSLFIPFAIIVPLMDMAEKFGKSRAYGLGLAFLWPIFWPMLAFGSATYQGKSLAKKRYDDDEDDEEEDEDEDERPRKRR